MSLRYLLLFQRDVPRAATFMVQALGLKARYITESFAELDAPPLTIAIKEVHREESDSKRKDIGSALVFNVPDVQETLTRVLATKEAEMDGPVQYDLEGNKTAAFRAFGQVFGLVERSPDALGGTS